MRVTFVDNFFARRERGENVVEILPHLGLMSLSSVLAAAGARARIVDPKLAFAACGASDADARFIASFAESLLSDRPDAIGFTAYGRSLPFAVKAAYAVKRRSPTLPVLLGGPHPTVLAREILEAFSCFDVVVRHEAEPIIAQLVDALVAGRSLDAIPNLVLHDRDGVHATEEQRLTPDLDALPMPDFSHYPVARLGLRELPVEAGRGCPFPCTFCSTSAFFGRRYRVKSPERLVAELDSAHARFGVRRFSLNHDLFGLHRPTVRAFCRLVRARGYTWTCSMRTDTLDPALLTEMVESGCVYIYFGVETGSARLQRTLAKKLDVDEARRRVAEVRAAGAGCAASFITGFPEETIADHRATLRLAGELYLEHAPDVDVQVHLLSPEPGSSLFERLGTTVRYDGHGPELGERPDDALVARYPRIFSVFHHFPTAVPRPAGIVAASLFTTVVPALGVPVARHVLGCVFEGRADVLVDEVAENLPWPLPERARLDDALLDALEVVVGARAPYARDVVRLVRLLGRRGGERRGAEDGDVAEEHAFEQDPLPALEHVLASPLARVPPDRLAARGAMYVLTWRRGEGVELHRVVDEIAVGEEAAP